MSSTRKAVAVNDGMIAATEEEDKEGDVAGDGMAIVIEDVRMSDGACDDVRIAGTAENNSAALPTGHGNDRTNAAAKATDVGTEPNKVSHRWKTGVDPAWLNTHPWISAAEGGMVCLLCTKHGRRPKRVALGKAVWVDIPCVSVRLDVVQKHAASEIHREAIRIEMALAGKGTQRLIQPDANPVTSAEKKAFIGYLKCMYWCTKEEIAQSTKFPSVVKLAKSLGCEYLDDLRVGRSVHYMSQNSIQNIVGCLGQTVLQPLLHDIQQSQLYAILIDETTDVSVKKQLIMYCRYMKGDSSTETKYIAMLPIPDGKAETITNAVLGKARELGLDPQKMVAMGSDGASVMLGRRSGVVARLKATVPWLIGNHCVAHRLALAAGQASGSVQYLNRFKSIVDQLFRFYNYSAVRTAGLAEIQKALDQPQLKLKHACDTRWLSHDMAVTALRRCLPAVVSSLSREAGERNDAQALGLLKFVQTYNFVAAVHTFCDVLPSLSQLSKAFQSSVIDLSVVKPLVQGTKSTIQALQNHQGDHMRNLPNYLDEHSAILEVEATDARIQQYTSQVYKPFLNALLTNLNDRFPDIDLIESFTVLDPSQLPHDDLAALNQHGNDKKDALLDHYDGFPQLNKTETKREWQLYKHTVVSDQNLADKTAVEMMRLLSRQPLGTVFPNLAVLAKIYLLIPVSTADCERGFSALARVKTKSRNSLSTVMLNSLMLLAIEGPAPDKFDFDAAYEIWMEQPRRVNVRR